MNVQIKLILVSLLLAASRLQHSGPLHFCTTPPCLEAAADLLAKQNSSHDPCTDFWGYACGGWLRRNPMPASASSWSVLEDLHHRQIVEKSRLITMSAHEPSQFNSVEWKVHNFYESCMALGKTFLQFATVYQNRFEQIANLFLDDVKHKGK